MDSYSDVLNKELKATTLDKTFVHAHEHSSKKNDEVCTTYIHEFCFPST